jgi:hypothetical protein
MRYVEAKLDESITAETYRIYIARSLQGIPQNKWIERDYYDIIHPEKVDDRSGDEIAVDIIKRAGLMFGE